MSSGASSSSSGGTGGGSGTSPNDSNLAAIISKLDLMGEAEVRSKLQLLMHEYVRLKSSSEATRSSLTEEQNKNRLLLAQLREKDAKVQTASEEVDLLNFNNKRLTKRIELLQEELSEAKKEGGSGVGSWFSSPGSKTELAKTKQELEIIRQELIVKIEENERIHIRIFETTQEHNQVTDQLKEKIGALQQTLAQQEQQFRDSQVRLDDQIQQLRSEMNSKSLRVSQLDDTVQKLTAQLDKREKDFKAMKTQLEADLQQINQLVARRVQFDDTAFQQFNEYNVPSCGKPIKKRVIEIQKQGLDVLRDCCDGLKMYFEAVKERAAITLQNKKHAEAFTFLTICRKLVDILPSASVIIDQLFSVLVRASLEFETKDDVSDETKIKVSATVKKFNALLRKISPYQILNVEHDEMYKGERPVAAALIKKVHTSFESIVSYILVMSYSGKNSNIVSGRNSEAIMEHFLQVMTRGHQNLKEMYHKMKLLTENENRNPFLNQNLKIVNERFLQSQLQILNSFHSIRGKIQDYLTTSSQPLDCPVRGIKPQSYNFGEMEDRARRFASALNATPDAEKVPYAVALRNASYIQSVEQMQAECLVRNSEFERKSKEIVQDKEKVAVELASTKDLVNAKQNQIDQLRTELATTRQNYDSLMEQYKRIQETIKSGVGGGEGEGNSESIGMLMESFSVLQLRPVAAESSSSQQKNYSMVVIDENGDQSNSLNVSPTDRERELALKQYYETKMNQLLSQAKKVDNKVIRYHTQYEQLKVKYNQMCEQNQEARRELEKTFQQLSSSKDDLESTRRNYEDQIRIFTEHMVQLNNRVGTQEEEVSRLKSHRVFCGKCGVWNSVGWLITDGQNGRVCSKGNHPSCYNFK